MVQPLPQTAPEPEIHSILVLSTGHLTERDCNEWMHTCPWSCFEKGEYGWFMYACPDEDGAEDDKTIAADVPMAVRSAIHKARQLGCEWIMFDRDGPELEDLPHYEW